MVMLPDQMKHSPLLFLIPLEWLNEKQTIKWEVRSRGGLGILQLGHYGTDSWSGNLVLEAGLSKWPGINDGAAGAICTGDKGKSLELPRGKRLQK